MRPGRLPEDHPLEQQARDQLRRPSPQAIQAAAQEQQPARPEPPPKPAPARWN